MGTVWYIVIIIIISSIISIETWLHIISLPYLQPGRLSKAIWRHSSWDWPTEWHGKAVATRAEWSSSFSSSPQTCSRVCALQKVTCLQGNRNHLGNHPYNKHVHRYKLLY